MGYEKLEDLLAAIGAGDVNGSGITQKILEDERRKREEAKTELEKFKPRVRQNMVSDASQGVHIMGTGGLLVNMARCCSPTAGDDIIGYVTRGYGVTVHRVDCVNVHAISDTERLVEVSWGSVSEEHTYIVPIEVLAQDREGLLRDISTVIADEKINITMVEVVTRQQIATLYISLELRNNHQLLLVLDKIECIASVHEARRVNPG
ncbi:MAG: ACT domain-containing protein [Anaerolineae bacterium]|nr:ACT domain-containing protein [Anaerolineae bacterium]